MSKKTDLKQKATRHMKMMKLKCFGIHQFVSMQENV